ncbi:type IX secretion system membrane protein PorP/SprF [Cytophagaceae bacterium ABcell3]|nr:type IX secretion system membrane protein PorP/SprF [Cytophagaceae bacterium ABcell3]
MKQTRYFVIFALFILFGGTANAQQDAQFSQYMFNSLYYNPGFAGVDGQTRFTGIHRTQWLNYEPTNFSGGAPQSTIISGSTLFPKQKIGVGGFMMYDRLGPITNINLSVSLSKHVKIGTGMLGLGVSGGFMNQRLHTGDYIVVNPEDEVYQQLVNSGGLSQFNPDLSAGIWYHHKKYYFGASFNHLIRPNIDFSLDGVNSRMSNHMYITGGYNFQVLPSLVVTPSALLQSDINTWTYLFGFNATFQEKIYAGLHVRQSIGERRGGASEGLGWSNDDIILMVGINLLKNAQGMDALRLGYAFDFVTSGVDAKKRTSHEIMLTYMIPNPFGQPNPPVRTPRYRHGD